ncbi:PEP-CTERM domain protein [Methylomarinum vadi]|uniref:PEP-CTERM domain protein n=1 Tax=Methylomarinum vadi TaxID=438855 RepID=UPI0004DF256F|nr:PEP-CTERM domain protein [Methylomarinum vadi]
MDNKKLTKRLAPLALAGAMAAPISNAAPVVNVTNWYDYEGNSNQNALEFNIFEDDTDLGVLGVAIIDFYNSTGINDSNFLYSTGDNVYFNDSIAFLGISGGDFSPIEATLIYDSTDIGDILNYSGLADVQSTDKTTFQDYFTDVQFSVANQKWDSGDVSTVPAPAPLYLFASGLAGLAFSKRKKNN